MIYCDGITSGENKNFDMLSALSSSGMYDPKMLFPDAFGKPEPVEPAKPAGVSDVSDVSDDPDDGEPVDDSNTAFDYSAVKWELPSDGDKAAMAQLAQIMSGNKTVSVSDDEPDGSQGFPLDFTPDDREWV